MQVYSDVSGGTSNRSSEPVVTFQLHFRVELGESNADDFVGPIVQFRCRLPQCPTPDTVRFHRGHRSSGMGYFILCHAGRKLIIIYLLSYSRSMSMIQGDNVTYKIAVGDTSRDYFGRNGTLDNQYDSDIRAINDQFAVFAIARDLGTIQVTQAPVVWTVGYTTDLAIKYTDLSGALPALRRPFYKIQYSTDVDLASIYGNCWEDYISDNKVQIVAFLNDFSKASSRARELDNKILQAANSVSNNLGGLVSVAIAQVYGSMQLTVGADTQGNLNDSDVMMFMKNIGGFGTK